MVSFFSLIYCLFILWLLLVIIIISFLFVLGLWGGGGGEERGMRGGGGYDQMIAKDGKRTNLSQIKGFHNYLFLSEFSYTNKTV